MSSRLSARRFHKEPRDPFIRPDNSAQQLPIPVFY